MNLKIVIRSSFSDVTWNKFADESNNAWLWHRSEYISAINTWPAFSDASFCILDRDQLVGIVPLHIFNNNSLNSLGGIALKNDVEPEYSKHIKSFAYKYMKSLAKSKNYSKLTISFSPLTPNLIDGVYRSTDLLTDLSFKDVSTSSWVINLLQPIETIRSGYSELTRRSIKKGNKTHFTIREASRKGDSDLYYLLHTETYQRTGVIPHPKEYFDYIFSNLQTKNLCRIVFLEIDGVTKASQNTAIYKNKALYWTGASIDDRAGFENRLLFDNQINYSKSIGCDYYEVGEAFPSAKDGKEKGLNDFKRSFGGELRPYLKTNINYDSLTSSFLRKCQFAFSKWASHK